MARIRTIKPSFFRHEKLQDLEIENPGKYVMLVFAGLFGHCDKNGVFEWNPRILKLDILPFLNFSMEETMGILEDAGLIRKGEAMGKQWGSIDSFPDHQRISGKELQESSKFPDPSEISISYECEAIEKQQGSTGEAVETAGREGKGREQEGKGIRALALPCPVDVDPNVWDDFLKIRKAKKAPMTLTAIKGLETEANKAGLTLQQAIEECCARGWQGFKADWFRSAGGAQFGKTSQGIALLEQMKG